MATNEPDVEMDHEYDQIVFTQTNPKHQIRESQSITVKHRVCCKYPTRCEFVSSITATVIA